MVRVGPDLWPAEPVLVSPYQPGGQPLVSKVAAYDPVRDVTPLALWERVLGSDDAREGVEAMRG